MPALEKRKETGRSKKSGGRDERPRLEISHREINVTKENTRPLKKPKHDEKHSPAALVPSPKKKKRGKKDSSARPSRDSERVRSR